MNLNDWEKLSEDTAVDYDAGQHARVIGGLQTLALLHWNKYGLQAEHDELFASGPSPEDALWSDDDLRKMAKWGWLWDDSLDSWKFYT
jgi:hypothetical protein